MDIKKTIPAIALIFLGMGGTIAQEAAVAEASPDSWTVFNRTVDFNKGEIHLNDAPNDGVLWLNGATFKSGVIELDIKGKDLRGQSFVGVAFHGEDDRTFEGIYFRPFNFESAERRQHAVQYISMPANDWSVLRNSYPGKYENRIDPVPDPDDWFHARIVVNFPKVSVYVNGAEQPSLEVEQLGSRGEGKVGLWVGNGSEGWFKNFTVTRAD